MIADRYELERRAGAGGMGEVFRARDRQTGAPLAVKTLRTERDHGTARFAREARALAELSHPAIVRYVAHGVAPSGEPFLVMEWLEGEDLASRLERGRLTVDESLRLGKQVADALAFAHARRIVHRDLKPSNIFLVGGDIAHVKLLDFGIVQMGELTRLTRTGLLLGTPGYMAPEQAGGERAIDARADVFSLGCVLYECLTGTAAFEGNHAMAILAKILLDEPPRARERCPELPPDFDALVARLLAKDPEERPRDGAEVVEALRAVGTREAPAESRSEAASASAVTLGRSERRAISLVLLGPERRGEARATETLPEESAAETLPEERAAPEGEGLRRAAEAFGGRFEVLCDGSAVALFAGMGMATDLAGQAARAALALRTRVPGRVMAVASGRDETAGQVLASDTLDRAASLLTTSALPPQGEASSPIRLDEMTAGLLDARFEVRQTEAGLVLRGELDVYPEARTLLGKPTPCVGREPELRALEAALLACIEEPGARALMITAEAGAGKTRLQSEFVAWAQARDEGVEIWTARGDPMRSGVPLGLLGQLVRRAAMIAGSEPISARRDKLRARVARHVEAPLRQRVTGFLGEVAGVRFTDDDDVQLRAARQDPKLLGDQVRQAFVDFLRAECRAHSVLIVLEDLQWGDAPTIAHLDAALRYSRNLPLMVLGLARPEVHERFPALWAEREVSEIRLGRLSRRACERLVREALGAHVPADTVAALVQRSMGNAFFLEELVRAAAEGREEAPGSVVAMMQSRIEALPPQARRILRAGSIFGEVFWRGAVGALAGGGEQLDDWLERLEAQELVARRTETVFRGEPEYAFRHGLVREAAYEILTDADRALGHRLAGAWLLEAGEPSAQVIAEHFDSGGEPLRAADLYRRAAEQALEGNDLTAVIARASRAAACGAAGEALGELLLLRAEAHFWRGDTAEAERLAREAMDTLPRRSDRWYAAMRRAVDAAERLGHHELLLELADVLERNRGETASAAEVVALSFTMGQCSSIGALDRARRLAELVEAAMFRAADDPRVLAAVATGRAMLAFMVGDVQAHRTEREIALAAFQQAGNTRAAVHEQCWLSLAHIDLGAYEEARGLLGVALAEAGRLELRLVAATAKYCLGTALARLGAFREAERVAVEAIEGFVAQGDERRAAGSRAVLADILRAAGDCERAELEARRAVDAGPPAWKPVFLATLADVLLARGQASEALVVARAAEHAAASRSDSVGEAKVRLAVAEALASTGDVDGARIAIAAARERLLGRAARIAAADLRRSFLQRVPENARTLERARAWLDG
ncbi:protein kinase domain-containing protein [Sorangium sp. So ce131]|uniref:serine/threonine-protein kinase n=1 Tax=Sorangium sp. So ce131 TaxID=3133282 RepID=UPI003F61EE98